MTSIDQFPALDADRVCAFDFYHYPGSERDYHQPWKDLQDHHAPHSLVWTTANGGHWIALRAAAIQDILMDYKRFSSFRMTIAPGGDRSGRWDVLPISLDPPEHTDFRSLLNAGLSPRAVRERGDSIRRFAADLVAELAPRGSCEFVADYGEVFPIGMVFQVMDLPISEKPRMLRVIEHMTTPDGSMTVNEIVDEFSAFLRPFIRQRRGGAGSDLITQVANGRIGDRTITENEAVQLCVQTFSAGLESVRNALSFTMLHLARNPDLRRGIAADPARIPKIIPEFLRRYAAMVMAREVADDTEFDGVRLRKGDMIAVPAHLAGLDDRENRCPMDFDPDRTGAVAIPFGAGPHFCAGRWLADLEMKVTLEEWLKRIPEFEIEPGETVSFSAGILGSVDRLPLRW